MGVTSAMDRQFTLGGDAVDARPAYRGKCNHVNETVKSTRYRSDPLFGGDPPPLTDPRTGECQRDAVVEVHDGARRIMACRIHARDEWLAAAEVD